MGRRTAYQLIAAAGIVENVRGRAQIPTCEYQTRPLVPLEPEQQREMFTNPHPAPGEVSKGLNGADPAFSRHDLPNPVSGVKPPGVTRGHSF